MTDSLRETVERLDKLHAGTSINDWRQRVISEFEHDFYLAARAAWPQLSTALQARQGWVMVPVEPTEEMLRAALDTRYCRSARSRKAKEMFPTAYETWLQIGMKEDAPDIRDEYNAMIAAAEKPE